MQSQRPSAPTSARRVTAAFAVITVAAVAVVLWRTWQDGSLGARMSDMSPLPFFALLALLPALGMPVTPLYILAGALFGVRVGILGTLVALAVNLVVCHRVAHSALRPRLLSVLSRFDRALPDYAAREVRQAVRFTLLVKFAPGLPTFAKNYILGLSGVPFGIYFGLSMVINGLYAVLLVVFGEAMLDHDAGGAVLPIVVLALMGLGVLVWHRRRRHGADA